VDLQAIQRRLREEIKYSGIPYKEIARAIGVTPSMVTKYMTRDKFPSLDKLAKLCAYLKVSADYILGIGDF
jgi:predicted transcriptional regulators